MYFFLLKPKTQFLITYNTFYGATRSRFYIVWLTPLV